MKYYAQIDENKKCIGVSQLSGEVIADNMIELESYDISLLGKIWNGSGWEDDPTPPGPDPEPAVTNEEIMEELKAMQGDQVPSVTLDAAYREGVNSYAG